MKKIYSIILWVAAVLCFAPTVSAQYSKTYDGIGTLTFKGEENAYGDNENVGFTKHISSPVDGKYWIKLEAFAKGSGVQTTTSKPSDIILVLDYSSSMSEKYGSTTRILALRSACRAFLTKIKENDEKNRQALSTYAGDRIAVVHFAGQNYIETEYNLTQISSGYNTIDTYFSGLDEDDLERGTYSSGGLEEAMKQWQDSDGNPTKDATRSRAVVMFTDGCPSTHGSYAFDCDIAGPAVNNAQKLQSDYGANVFTIGLFATNHSSWNSLQNYVLDYMNYMSSNFPSATATYTSPRNYLNTDGSINGTITYANNGNGRNDEKYADQEEAQDGNSDFFFMASDDPSSLEAIFESVASSVAADTNTALSEATSTIDIVSSSFVLSFAGDNPSASDIKLFTAPYLYDATKKEGYFGTETVAPEGVEVDEDQLADNIVEVTGFDYSSNWCGLITEGGQVVGAHSGKKLIILIPIEMSEDAVGGPNVATNAEGSGIWIDKETDTEPLVKFTSPTVSLPVNLWIEKKLFVSEANNVITTKDMPHGENTKFVIKRGVTDEKPGADDDATWHPDYSKITNWEYVTSVFVPNKNGSNVVKIQGLPSTCSAGNYVYKVIEEDWGWTYSFYAATGQGYVKDDEDNVTIDNITIKNGMEVYSDQFVVNPITIVNKEEADSDQRVRHAESKVTNTFNESGTKKYSDSKENGRTQN